VPNSSDNGDSKHVGLAGGERTPQGALRCGDRYGVFSYCTGTDICDMIWCDMI